MNKIEKVDKNFKIESKINKPDIVFHNILNNPFQIYGIFYENGKFRRMPESVARSVSEGVYSLHSNTTGGRVKFKTDSNYVAISAFVEPIGHLTNMPLAGSTGFDLYVKEDGCDIYRGTFIPPCNVEDHFESVIDFDSTKTREITINFPVYTDVINLYIGISDASIIEKADSYKNEKPIVFYGSSITQGGCASRPGNIYPSIISRELGVDFINLGFSGNAKVEKEISEYIKNLNMSVFVYDYDYNAPTIEHLKNTHEAMFVDIREKNNDLPIIIMPRPKLYNFLTDEGKERFNVIKTTYENAVKRGDENVYFVSGDQLMNYAQSEGLVDNCHPNDFGFYSMAKALIDILKTYYGF